MKNLVKKLHMYLGLLNLTILFVFGLTGLIFLLRGRVGPEPKTVVRFEDLKVPASLKGGLEVAEYLRKQLHIPMVNFNSQRDSDNHRVIVLGTHNEVYTVTVLEKENRLRMAVTNYGTGNFVDMLHASPNFRASDLRVRLWGLYVEFAIWSLVVMSLTGIYLWLSSRPGYGWAQLTFGVGSSAFVLLYILTK